MAVDEASVQHRHRCGAATSQHPDGRRMLHCSAPSRGCRRTSRCSTLWPPAKLWCSAVTGVAVLLHSTPTVVACFTAAPPSRGAPSHGLRRSFSAAPPPVRLCYITAPRRPPYAALQRPTARVLLHHSNPNWLPTMLQCRAATGAAVPPSQHRLPPPPSSTLRVAAPSQCPTTHQRLRCSTPPPLLQQRVVRGDGVRAAGPEKCEMQKREKKAGDEVEQNM